MECPAPASDHTTSATTSDFNLRIFQHLFLRIFSYAGITKEESETTEFFLKKKTRGDIRNYANKFVISHACERIGELVTTDRHTQSDSTGASSRYIKGAAQTTTSLNTQQGDGWGKNEMIA
jgi:hypothetical protein